MKKIILLISLLSGYVSAQNSIEEGVRLFNQKEYDKAQHIFELKSKQGSAYATFWLGVTQYKNRQQFEAGDTLLKAAKMGSPWAMDVLAGNGNSPCQFLGWQCDKSWTDKAIPLWEEQAKNGNGKAMYQLVLRGKPWWEIVPFYRYTKYREIYSKAIPAGGYKFLFSSVAWESEDERVEYLKLAAKQGYAPAMTSLYNWLVNTNYEEAKKWADKAIQLGYAPSAKAMYYTYSQGEKNIQPDPSKAYYYNELFRALGGDAKSKDYMSRRVSRDEHGYPIQDSDGNIVFDVLVAKEDQEQLDKLVVERIKGIKPNMFLDETSIDLF